MGSNEDFNAVIEGAHPDEWMFIRYKLAYLEIPPDATSILARSEKKRDTWGYILCGKVNGGVIEKLTSVSKKEVKLSSLEACPGLVLLGIDDEDTGYTITMGTSNILYRARTVITRDGRIFVARCMFNDQTYMRAIKIHIFPVSQFLFADDGLAERLSREYERIAGVPFRF